MTEAHETGTSPTPISIAIAALGEEYFNLAHSTDPLTATVLGVEGFDHLLPDPSRSGSRIALERFEDLERRVKAVTPPTSHEDKVNLGVLESLVFGARSDLEHRLWEANASAGSYVSPQGMAFQSVPVASIHSTKAVEDYLERLGGLGEYFDRIRESYESAYLEGKYSPKVGISQAIDQLDGHLSLGVEKDSFINVPIGDGYDTIQVRSQIRSIVEGEVWPAMARLRGFLSETMLPKGRPDDRVGICFVDGGEAGYRDAVRKHTTLDLSPQEIHAIGRGVLDQLESEWLELGEKVLSETTLEGIFDKLRGDPALRFESSSEIVSVVTDALQRANAALPGWFVDLETASCVIEEINPVEARNAALAYYRPPSADGSRPGAHCVLTTDPQERYRYEYEALAFHESTPGHHLQIATSQALPSIPRFRRYLDAEVCGFVEGWGLYSERLADEMGLYSSDLARLGMLSFDALRACRLVVDTGMHYYGWSREKAAEFMWNNCATTRANVDNEIDRYIAWPGQALAYMVGKREILRQRSRAQEALGSKFSMADFHRAALHNGALPLSVLNIVVDDLIEANQAS